ncbi:hypothetical protein D3C84_1169690 [compost metagenome]
MSVIKQFNRNAGCACLACILNAIAIGIVPNMVANRWHRERLRIQRQVILANA